MESKELNLNKECKGGEGFFDRSKVRILLCDNDEKSLEEVFTLLLKCSYQVTPVRSARQVIDALNADGPDIDIILAEVDLPLSKGTKMLKYIMRDKELRRIPVIMMSAQDEVSIVVKCLRLGAADYLVKPLRTNELLNLWTHMWRRRRMLGLAEKNIINYDFDLVGSDPSDANTNSTTLFSDDTEDKSCKSIHSEMGVSTHQEDESSAAATATATATAAASTSATATAAASTSATAAASTSAAVTSTIAAVATSTIAATAAAAAATTAATDVAAVELLLTGVVECQPDVPGISDRRRGQFSSGPKKSELKIGESSAFFTYVKSSVLKNNCKGVPHVDENAAPHFSVEEKLQASGRQGVNDAQVHENGEAWESYSQGDDFNSSTSVPDSYSLERSCTPPMSMEFPQRNFRDEIFSQLLVNPRNESQVNASGVSAQTAYPYYMSGVLNQVMMPPSAQLYPKNFHDLHGHATSAILSQYNHLQQCSPHVNGMASLPCYPVSMCLQPGQMFTTYSWPSLGNSSSTEVKLNKVDRREAALIKFRQKRKERCFDKKIRYVNRKRLAERRPRVRGQFVTKVNGVNVDLNGQPASTDFDEDEEEEE